MLISFSGAKGAPDPLRGDALWQSVRTEAQVHTLVIFLKGGTNVLII